MGLGALSWAGLSNWVQRDTLGTQGGAWAAGKVAPRPCWGGTPRKNGGEVEGPPP